MMFMATSTDERRLTAMMTRLFPRLGRTASPAQVAVLPAPIPEVAPQAAHEETTAVARYDAVTRKVAVEDILGADLPASAAPAAPVPVPVPAAFAIAGSVAAPAAPPLAAGTTASTRTVRRPRRTALGMLIAVAAILAWSVASYEVWYLFLR